MDYFFYQGNTREATSYWFIEIPPRSDFIPYIENLGLMKNVIRIGRKNVKIRLVEMLKKIAEARALRNDRSTRNMMKERLRRQSHKDGYEALHALLPVGTKCDKISVITSAASEIARTRSIVEDLRRRNAELNKKLADQWNVSDRMNTRECSSNNVKMIRVAEPAVSGIVSLVDALHCFKETGMCIRKMRAQIGDREFSAEIEVTDSHRAVC